MRYHYEKPDTYSTRYGTTYKCDHPVYSRCTIFRIGKRGLAVIQQRFDPVTKHTWWDTIDPWLNDELYLHPRFKEYFDNHASEADKRLYFTITIRQLMWALKMRPLPREPWETYFDRKDI